MAQNQSSEVWELDHLDDLSHNASLAALVRRIVVRLSVEFLFTNGIKPHVVFNLRVNPTAQDPRPRYQGVRLSMEWSSDEEDTGDFQIKGLEYIESSRSAHGAFDFPILSQLPLLDWCNIIRGSYRGLPASHLSDLTDFRFVMDPRNRKMDGCRDFICQSFMRFYELRIVQGCGLGLGTRSSFQNFQLIPRRPELGTDDAYWFFDIIDKNFVKTGQNTGHERIVISVLPMHRGIFGGAVVRREEFIVGQRRYPLNYLPQPGQAPQAGRGGGAPGPSGSGSGMGRGNAPQGGRPGQPGYPPAGGSSTGAGRGGAGSTGAAGGPQGNQLGRGAGGRQPAAPVKPVAGKPGPRQPLAPTTANNSARPANSAPKAAAKAPVKGATTVKTPVKAAAKAPVGGAAKKPGR